MSLSDSDKVILDKSIRPLQHPKLAFEVGVAALQSVVFYNTGTLMRDFFKFDLAFEPARAPDTKVTWFFFFFRCNRKSVCFYNL